MMLVRRRRRAGDAAFHLRIGDALREDRKRFRRIVARLPLYRGPVDRAAVEPWRRAGLETAECKAGALQRA